MFYWSTCFPKWCSICIILSREDLGFRLKLKQMRADRMKKIFVIMAVVTVCTIAYFKLAPEDKQLKEEGEVLTDRDLKVEEILYMDESEVQAYLNLGLMEKQSPDDTDVQAYTPTDVMKGDDRPKKKKKRYHAVRHYKPRASSLGFSITPPPGSNWFEKLEKDSLYYVKINKLHKQYAILTEAREVRLSKTMKDALEIQNFVKREKEKTLASARFRNPNLTVEVKTSPSEKCVRYRKYYEDHGMKGLDGRRYVNVDTQGLFCLHPSNSKVAIDMNYVEKSLSNTQVTSYSSEGEKFLASLKFH